MRLLNSKITLNRDGRMGNITEIQKLLNEKVGLQAKINSSAFDGSVEEKEVYLCQKERPKNTNQII